MVEKRYEVKVMFKTRIADRLWTNDYDEAMDKIDEFEEQYRSDGYRVEFTDHQEFTGKWQA